MLQHVRCSARDRVELVVKTVAYFVSNELETPLCGRHFSASRQFVREQSHIGMVNFNDVASVEIVVGIVTHLDCIGRQGLEPSSR